VSRRTCYPISWRKKEDKMIIAVVLAVLPVTTCYFSVVRYQQDAKRSASQEARNAECRVNDAARIHARNPRTDI